MNDNNLFEKAFDAIDDEFLAEAKHPSIRIAARRKKILIGSIAACIAAILVTVPSIKIISDLNNNQFTNSIDTEIIYQEEIIYDQSSEQTQSSPQDNTTGGTTSFVPPYTNISLTVNDLFNAGIVLHSAGGTTSYQKIYVPSIEYLYITPIPADKYVTIYEYFPIEQKNPTEQELRAIAEKYLPKFSKAIGIPTPKYTIETYSENDINVRVSTGEKNTYFYISNTMLKFGKSSIYEKTDVPLNIYGETVVIDQRKTDAEILASLSGIKEKLGKLFGKTFIEPKIIREFSSYTTNGAEWINISYKTSDDSGSLIIKFDNFANHADDIVSSTNLYNASIMFFPKSSNDKLPSISKQVELLPLQKAEEYLSKGYVLAIGGCPLCQAMQDPVDFTNYDYVGISYMTTNNKKIPYYCFYKNIGASENGNMTFAYTYVPAIEVAGYEEYFENKHAQH